MAHKVPYTVVGTAIWTWQRFRALPSDAKVLYLALYTSPVTKRIVPGLFHGGIHSLAETSSLQPEPTFEALQTLIDVHLAEWDKELSVIRITELPDSCERPSNGNVIRGWWSRFRSVPECGVRDAHVTVLRTLLDSFDQEDSNAGGRARAWEETFATIKPRANRHRGSRQVIPDGSSSPAQAELFAAPPNRDGSPNRLERDGDRDRDRESDLERVSFAAGTGCHTPVAAGPPDAPPEPHVPTEHEPSMPGVTVPLARVVPLRPPLPFTIAQLLDTLEMSSGGRFQQGAFEQRLAKPLTETIRACAAAGVTLEGVAQVGTWLRGGGLAYRGVLGPLWLAQSGSLLDAFQQARASPPRGGPAPTTPPGPSGSRPEPTTSTPRSGRRSW